MTDGLGKPAFSSRSSYLATSAEAGATDADLRPVGAGAARSDRDQRAPGCGSSRTPAPPSTRGSRPTLFDAVDGRVHHRPGPATRCGAHNGWPSSSRTTIASYVGGSTNGLSVPNLCHPHEAYGDGRCMHLHRRLAILCAALASPQRYHDPLDELDTILGGLVIAANLYRNALACSGADGVAQLRNAVAAAPGPIQSLIRLTKVAIDDAIVGNCQRRGQLAFLLAVHVVRARTRSEITSISRAGRCVVAPARLCGCGTDGRGAADGRSAARVTALPLSDEHDEDPRHTPGFGVTGDRRPRPRRPQQTVVAAGRHHRNRVRRSTMIMRDHPGWTQTRAGAARVMRSGPSTWLLAVMITCTEWR